MKVVSDGRFSVYVYSEIGVKHHWPHCHVRWVDGETVVMLPGLTIIAGVDLPKPAKELLRGNIDEIVDKWIELNSR